MEGLESVYKRHHTKDDSRKRNHAIMSEERSAYIQKHVPAGSKILDIGCRDGELIQYYNNGYDILGLDIDSEALAIAKEKTGIETRQCDLNGDWGVEPDSFDAVVACEVIEHLYHPDTILEKIATALKPGGVVVGSIPHAFNIQTRLKFLFGRKDLSPLADPTHINHFTVAEFEGLMKRQFSDVEIVSYTTPKYRFLKPLFPHLFSHTILFSGKDIEKI